MFKKFLGAKPPADAPADPAAKPNRANAPTPPPPHVFAAVLVEFAIAVGEFAAETKRLSPSAIADECEKVIASSEKVRRVFGNALS